MPCRPNTRASIYLRLGLRTARRFVHCRQGTTAIEYAFLAGLISLAALGAFQLLGETVLGMFTHVSSGLTGVISTSVP